jgi:hypothetical protein
MNFSIDISLSLTRSLAIFIDKKRENHQINAQKAGNFDGINFTNNSILFIYYLTIIELFSHFYSKINNNEIEHRLKI